MFLFKSLHLENFMSISSADFEFSDNQITAITGDNGQGKSTLFTAIAYCLTGYRKGETVKNYVKTGTDCAQIHLEAYFKGEPITYDIAIYNTEKQEQKHLQATSRQVVYKGETYLNSDYTRFIKDYGLEELESLMFMFQGSSSIIDASPAERAKILKKLFKFEFPEAVDFLKNKLEQDKITNSENTAVLNELQTHTFETLPLLREVTKECLNLWETKLDETTQKLEKIGNINEHELQDYENSITETQKIINNYSNKNDQDTKAISSLKTQISVSEAFLKTQSLENIQKLIEKSQEAINQHIKEYSLQKTKIDSLNKELNIFQYEEQELSKQLEISKTGVCHACGQPIEESHVIKLQKAIQETQEKIKSKKQEILNLNFDSQDIFGNKLQQELNYNKNLLEKYNQEVKNKEFYENKLQSLEEGIKERTQYIASLETKKDALLETKGHLEEIIPLLKEKEVLLQEQETVSKKLQEAKDTSIKNVARRSVNQKLTEDKNLNDLKIKELNEKINTITVEMAKTKEELSIIETEFPNFIVLHTCQQLEAFINTIVQKVFPYCKVVLKLSKGGVNFFYTAESSDEELLPVSMASSAQGNVLALAYFIALAKLSGMPCIFLDEIDSACSIENAKIIYDFISTIDYFPQMFFITHKPEAIDIVRENNPDIIIYNTENGTYTEV